MRSEIGKCPRCEVYDSPEAVCHLAGIGYYDVRAAERILRRRPRKPRELPPVTLKEFVSERSVYMPHVPHVNTRKYGIVAKYHDPKVNDERFFMLDGNHRAFMSLKLGRTFKVYILTRAESDEVFTGKRAPRGKAFVTR